jgi:hypothetical protein
VTNLFSKYKIEQPLLDQNINKMYGDYFPKDFIKLNIKDFPSMDYMDALKKMKDDKYFNDLIADNITFTDNMPVIKPNNFRSNMPVLKPDSTVHYHIRVLGTKPNVGKRN